MCDSPYGMGFAGKWAGLSTCSTEMLDVRIEML